MLKDIHEFWLQQLQSVFYITKFDVSPNFFTKTKYFIQHMTHNSIPWSLHLKFYRNYCEDLHTQPYPYLLSYPTWALV